MRHRTAGPAPTPPKPRTTPLSDGLAALRRKICALLCLLAFAASGLTLCLCAHTDTCDDTVPHSHSADCGGECLDADKHHDHLLVEWRDFIPVKNAKFAPPEFTISTFCAPREWRRVSHKPKPPPWQSLHPATALVRLTRVNC